MNGKVKRIEQRGYDDDQIIDTFKPADLIDMDDWLATAQVGSRYERFTGQTYLVVVA